jgi:ABC-type sulfate transport system substrate-binding protein
MYTETKAAARFKSIEDKVQVEAIFNFLYKNKEALLTSTNHKRPALEGVIEAIEKTFPNFDLNKHQNRQVLGSMTRFIMGYLGKYPVRSKALKKGSYLKTALYYE